MGNLRSKLGAGLLLLTSGCYVDAYAGYDEPYYDDHPYYRPEGVLLVDWSIAGVIDPRECRFSGAYGTVIIIETPGGSLVREYADDCDAFGASFALPPGPYVATVVLVDEDGYDRTTEVSVPIRIYDGHETELPVDFPPDSFY